MPRLLWITDIHLNFLRPNQVEDFLVLVEKERPDGILLGGDISEYPDVLRYLRLLVERWNVPIYFVLGNHDYYYTSIRGLRTKVIQLQEKYTHLHWLNRAEVVQLSDNTALIGHDGWADARLGDYERSFVMMNDYRFIEELAPLNKQDRWDILKELGDEAAEHFRRLLIEALTVRDHVLLLTHVPPFREACWHEGQISNDEWLPHFSCRSAGDALREVMRQHPYKQLTVLCGHTHGRGECRPEPNIHVLTGGARYGEPEIQRLFEID